MRRQAPTIVYLNGRDEKREKKAEVNNLDVIQKMLQTEPDILRSLEFYMMYMKLAKFQTEGASSLKIKNDQARLQRFLVESIVYYFAYGFVAFRLVPYDKEERDFFPVAIPFHQIDFEYDEEDINSIFCVPSVWYKQYDSQSNDVPLIFVYKFQNATGIHQSLGPMQTLVDSYLDMQKIREYNEIVLTEHKYTLQYVEQDQVNRVSNETMAALEQTYYEMDERILDDDCGDRGGGAMCGGSAPADVTKRTRNIISAQVIDFENDLSSEISGNIRKNVVVLPPGSRVSASTARQLSFHSQGESDLFFSKHVLRVFGVPEQWRQTGGNSTSASQKNNEKQQKQKSKQDNNTASGSKSSKTKPAPEIKFTTPICIQAFYSEMQNLLSEMSSALCSPVLFQHTYSRKRKRRKTKAKHRRKHDQPDSVPFQELCMPISVSWKVSCDEKELSEFHGADTKVQ